MEYELLKLKMTRAVMNDVLRHLKSTNSSHSEDVTNAIANIDLVIKSLEKHDQFEEWWKSIDGHERHPPGFSYPKDAAREAWNASKKTAFKLLPIDHDKCADEIFEYSVRAGICTTRKGIAEILKKSFI